jgi:ATP-dependent 26S proteasome regulatory subunit
VPEPSDTRSKANVVSSLEATPPDHLERFSDVGGLDAIKHELRDVITLLVDSQEFAAQYRIGWNGVLLHGAPGVGKTLLARACAGELGLAFVYVSTADAVSKWIGEAPSKIDDAFRFAAAHVPCILFFDEFDSLASDRGDEHHLEYRRLTNQLLESLEEYRDVRGLVVMAATNAYDCLDPAVVRAGRFDRHIEIPMPDLDARIAILQVHLNGRRVADDVNPRELAELTEGWSAADLQAVVESASVACATEATQRHAVVPIDRARLFEHVQRRMASLPPSAPDKV